MKRNIAFADEAAEEKLAKMLRSTRSRFNSEEDSFALLQEMEAFKKYYAVFVTVEGKVTDIPLPPNVALHHGQLVDKNNEAEEEEEEEEKEASIIADSTSLQRKETNLSRSFLAPVQKHLCMHTFVSGAASPTLKVDCAPLSLRLFCRQRLAGQAPRWQSEAHA